MPEDKVWLNCLSMKDKLNGTECQFSQSWLNSSVTLSLSALFFSSRKKIRQSEHTAGSGKQSSTGVSITTSYVTGATHAHTHIMHTCCLRGSWSVVYPSAYKLPLSQSHSDDFQLPPNHIKPTPCLIERHISSFSINNTSGEKLWM